MLKLVNMKQKEFVLNELKYKGWISRDLCLRFKITRLGAIINLLKKEGIEFNDEKAGYKETEYGKNDYVYYLKDTSNKPPEAKNSSQNDLKLVNGSLFNLDNISVKKAYKPYYEF